MLGLNLSPAHVVESRTLDQLRAAIAAVAGVEGDAGTVAAALYAGWYARASEPQARVPAHFPPELVEVLRASHAGRRRWETGWRAESVGRAGQVVARRGPAVRLLERIDYVAVDRPGLLPRPGDDLRVSGACDTVDPDGWWRTWFPPEAWRSPPPGLVRLYWNAGLAELPGLIDALTGELADEDDPWLLKCAVDPAEHGRADAVVAYVTAGAADRRAGAFGRIAAGLVAGAGAPPLTLPVGPGLAAAADPGGDESFGGHRCRLVAEAVVGAAGAGPAAVLHAVVERLAADGVDLARPWARRDDPALPWER